MDGFKKHKSLMALVLCVLVSCTPIKAEPISFPLKIALGSAVSLIIGAIGYWWWKWLPSPEKAIQEADSAYQGVSQRNHSILQACGQDEGRTFRSSLCNQFLNTRAVHDQRSQLDNDLRLLEQHRTQLQRVRTGTKGITAEQIRQLREQEEVLTTVHVDLSTALDQFKRDEPYFMLHAQLKECEQPLSRHGMFPTVNLVRDMQKREEKLDTIQSKAQSLGDFLLANRATCMRDRSAEEREVLEGSSTYKIEYRAYLNHQSRMECQREANAERERQERLNRQHELKKIEYRKALDMYVEQGYPLWQAILLVQLGVYPSSAD